MEAALHSLLDWIAAHGTWAGVIVFLIALSESLAVIGVLVPGVLFMFGIGALIATGHLSFWPTMAWAVAGAIAGDGLSFWLGRHYHQRLRVIWPFNRYPQLLARGVDFFYRHGGKGIVLGRFIGPLRAIIPAVAGMLDMPVRRFAIANVISALFWAPLYLLPGIAFGASLALASEVALRLSVFLLLVLAVAWFSIWLLRRIYALLAPRTNVMIFRALRWSSAHPRLGNIPAALLDPDRPELRGLTLLALILILAALGFAGVLRLAYGGPILGNLDALVLNRLAELHTPLANQLMVALSGLGSAPVLGAVFALVLGWLCWQRHWHGAVHWFAAAALPALLIELLRWLLPANAVALGLVPATHAALAQPEAHVTLSLAVYGFLAVLVVRELPVRWHPLVYTVAGLLVTVIAFARLYLGVHWLSDVLGGLSVGLAWVALLGIAYRRHPSAALPARGLLLVSVLGIAGAAVLYGTLRLPAELRALAPPAATQTMSEADWWRRGWRELPALRGDLRGRHRHPLTIQWAAPRAAIVGRLEAHGWYRPSSPTPRNLLQWFRAQPGIDELPVLPQVHDGAYESILLVRRAGPRGAMQSRLLVLRLWHSPLRVARDRGTEAQPAVPVWIGNVSYLHPVHVVGLTVLESDVLFAQPLRTLQAELGDLPHVLRRRAPFATEAIGTTPGADWTGQVLLIKQ